MIGLPVQTSGSALTLVAALEQQAVQAVKDSTPTRTRRSLSASGELATGREVQLSKVGINNANLLPV